MSLTLQTTQTRLDAIRNDCRAIMKPNPMKEILDNNPALYEQVSISVETMLNDGCSQGEIINHVQNMVEDETDILVLSRETRQYLYKEFDLDGPSYWEFVK